MALSEKPEPTRRHKRLVLLSTLFIVLLALGWLAAVCYYAGLDLLVRSKNFGRLSRARIYPDIRERFEIWYSKPITFPPEALKVHPFSLDLIQSETNAETELNQLSSNLKVWINGSTFDTFLSKNAEEDMNDLKQIEPVVKAFDAVINNPAYRDSGSPPNYFIERNGSPMTKAMRLKVFALSHQKQHKEALHTAQDLMQSSLVSPYEGLIRILIAAAMADIGTDAWRRAVEVCDDPVLLRDSLRAQNEMAPLVGFYPDIPIEVLDRLGSFHEAQRRNPNLKVNLQGKTGREIFAEWLRILSETGVTPPSRSESKRFVQILERDWPIPVPEALAREIPFCLFAQAMPNDLEARSRCKRARAQFEMLRVLTASRIYQLEKGKPPESTQALIPDYLPKTAVDPFAPAKAPIILSPSVGPYSLGPDQKNDGGKINYDPSNGTLSAGNIIWK